MGLFGGKTQKKPQSPENYDLEEKLFPISKPWGYSPRHVSEAIMHYNQVIDSQNAAIAKLKEALARERNEKKKIDKELKNLQLQLNFVSVPTMSDIQEEYIQNQFEDQFGTGPRDEAPAPKKATSKASLLRDVSAQEERKEQEQQQASEEPPKKERKRVSVKNPFGGREDDVQEEDSYDGLVGDMATEPKDEGGSDDMSFDLDSFGVQPKQEAPLPKKKISIATKPKQEKVDGSEALGILTASAAGLDDFVTDEDFGNAAQPSGGDDFDFAGGSNSAPVSNDEPEDEPEDDQDDSDGDSGDGGDAFDEFTKKFGF